MRQLNKISDIKDKIPTLADLPLGALSVNTNNGGMHIRQDDRSQGGSDRAIEIYRGLTVHGAVDIAERDTMVADGIIGPMQMCFYKYDGIDTLELWAGPVLGWRRMEHK